MRRLLFSSVALALLAIAAITAARTDAQTRAAAPSFPVWEYKVVAMRELGGTSDNRRGVVSNLETGMNRLGGEGWEVCFAINGDLYFKRSR